MTTFAELGLSENALRAVEALGYAEPTPVQERAIPVVLGGSDIIAAAKTGTGKTAAFSLPCLDRIGRAKKKKKPLMLVVTPTRELAAQIAETCSCIAKVSKHRIASVVGGVAMEPQIKKLAAGVDVLIATPGRLIDLMNQQAVELDGVEILVLDEADRMLDMGFLPSMRTIVNATPESRQTLLFSATVDRSIRTQMGSLLRDPEIIQIAHKGETADTVAQYVAHVPQTLKFDLLKAVLKKYGHRRVIVFARTRHRADSTCRRLKKIGFHAEALHSDRSQNQRDRALRNFASGETDILVATDVLARGIDVEGVSYVVNFDIPNITEDYVHRIGRTGRAGSEGFALSFVTPETADDLAAIEKFIKKSIPAIEVEGFDVEAAATEAVERANRAQAKRDPELAQAVREIKQKQKRKAKAKERAAEEALLEAERQKNGASRKKAKPKPAGKKTSVKAKQPKAKAVTPAKAKASAPAKAKASSAPKPKSAPSTKTKTAKVKGPSAGAVDNRPGRAQRAMRARRNKA